MKNFLKRIASRILKDELDSYSRRIDELVRDRDALVDQCAELNRDIRIAEGEKNVYKQRMAASLKYILPNGVVAKIIGVLPDPNEVAYKMDKLLPNNDYIITGGPVNLEDGEKRNWFFEVKFEKLVKISDVKIMLYVTLRNNSGSASLEIPAVRDHLRGNDVEIDTWVWNLWEAGLAVLPDNLYAVMYKACEAWNNIKHELEL